MHRSNSSYRCLGLISPSFPPKKIIHHEIPILIRWPIHAKSIERGFFADLFSCRNECDFFSNVHDSIFMVRIKHYFIFFYTLHLSPNLFFFQLLIYCKMTKITVISRIKWFLLCPVRVWRNYEISDVFLGFLTILIIYFSCQKNVRTGAGTGN